MKRIILIASVIIVCIQITGCTYRCDICGKNKFGFSGTTVEFQGREVTVCKSCKELISGIANSIIPW